ncbi:MAG: hypothetical protein ACTS2F_10425 [Thainema sp.]
MTDSQKLVLMIQPVKLQGLIWQAVLKSQGISVIWESPQVDFIDNVRQLKQAGLALPDAILVDVGIEGFNPYAFCRLCRDRYSEMQVILTNTARSEIHPSERQWALHQGAADYLPAFEPDSLVTSVTHGVKAVLQAISPDPIENGALVSVLFSIKRQIESRKAAKQTQRSADADQTESHVANYRSSTQFDAATELASAYAVTNGHGLNGKSINGNGSSHGSNGNGRSVLLENGTVANGQSNGKSHAPLSQTPFNDKTLDAAEIEETPEMTSAEFEPDLDSSGQPLPKRRYRGVTY